MSGNATHKHIAKRLNIDPTTVRRLVERYGPELGIIEKRVAEHQTAAPTARLVKSWRCKRSWDYGAMDSISREGCTSVLNEVFEGDPGGFVSRAAAFFALMPNPEASRALSEHSPLREHSALEVGDE